MKPRPQPRALTLRDVVIAIILLLITLLCIGLVAIAGTAVGLPSRWILAIAAALLFCYPLALNWSDMRVALRIRRGRCPACGYDRSGLANPSACPECGTVPN
jgi:hypothetical protein